jgi:SagB-type dehydrogenase family enzyme
VSEPRAVEVVRRYHERSTHRPGRYAPGPGLLDWANQPDPFRTWSGAPRVELPLAPAELGASWDDLHVPGAVSPRPLDRGAIGAFFELALGLTAWKEYRGSRWSLRANPSSGNLHPTEGYALLSAVPGLAAGLYHYLSRDHVLERRLAPREPEARQLEAALPQGCFLLGLSSIHWREAWKYGERSFRYCQHDAGHALAAAAYAAAVLGWEARLLGAPGDEDVSAILALDGQDPVTPPDREHADALVLVAARGDGDAAVLRVEARLDDLRTTASRSEPAGRPNALSREHVEWAEVERVAEATRKPRTMPSGRSPGRAVAPAHGAPALAPPSEAGSSAVALVRQRRSAVAFDGVTGMPGPVFWRVLDRLLPRPGVPPWSALPGPPRVHPVLFVHRVDAVAPGLYLLVRDPTAGETLRRGLRPSFSWRVPPSCPSGIPLVALEEGDCQPLARFASCHQEIASDSAFAVAMLAELGPALEEGAWWYRHLHWEAGVLGQVLYLEAEAAGLRGTGIGCFFDDVVHELLGLDRDRFRDLYHFTIGGPVEDTRLTTSPGYDDAVRSRTG